MMTREDMINSIQDILEQASDTEVESVYWTVVMEVNA